MTNEKPLKWWSSPRTLLRHILMLDDAPHSIALGTAIGMFIGMTPTVGIQMILVIVVAFLTQSLFRFNRVAALITVYISNPLTVAPIYFFHYIVGTLFVGGNITWNEFSEKLRSNSDLGWWQEWWEKINWLFVEVGAPLILGSLVVATVLGIATYPVMRRLLRSFRKKKSNELRSEREPITTVAD